MKSWHWTVITAAIGITFGAGSFSHWPWWLLDLLFFAGTIAGFNDGRRDALERMKLRARIAATLANHPAPANGKEGTK